MTQQPSARVTHTLEGYPALASYALNRVFVHAKAGQAFGADPKEFLEKLVLQDRWSRWRVLQEVVPDYTTWQGFLPSQGLGPWVAVADDLVRGENSSY